MKKGRPGFLLSVITESQQVPALLEGIFSGTTTSGVRLRELDRVKLEREIVELDTRYGKVKAKVFTLDTGTRCAPEYEDCLRISREMGIPVSEIMEETRNAFRKSRDDSA
jgi:uncharacterized protein (DUF111 family)